MANDPNDPSLQSSHVRPQSSVGDALSRKGAPAEAEAPGATPGHGHAVTAAEIGHYTPEEQSRLSQPISIGGPSYLDRAVFCRNFATLTEVGIPVLRALQMLTTRTSHGKLRKAVQATALGVEQGQTIHQAMQPHAGVFSPLVVNIVRIGERGGILEGSLVRLAEIMESKARIKRQIVSALMYPFVVVCIALLAVALIMIKAVPAFSAAYNDPELLPAPTKLVIAISDFFVSFWPVLLVAFVALIIGLRLWAKTASGRHVFSLLAIRFPVIKGINRKIAVARSARTLGGLINAGIPLAEAIGIAAETNENTVVCDALARVQTAVQNGERMTDPLEESGIFPPMAVDMIGVGEETGTLDRMLGKLADIYDAEVDSALTGLASIIEPLLIVLLGGVVLFIAIAALLPYFNLVHMV